ncbi:MAG: hypothetical protein H5T86_13405, partial [Armatimonadetes bacterium]|nr:hypothetical protein [Armatimonadota bacterium]
TCCPETSVILNGSQEAWLLTAARNLSIADAAGADLFTPCNGCMGTLKGARQQLLHNPRLMQEVNEKLAAVGRRFTGRARVLHLIEVLHDEIGTDVIARRVKRPLVGMKVAVHAGCHQMRPSREVKTDDPMHPHKFESIVSALGAEVIDYPSKLMCCGGTMNTAGLTEDARQMTGYKLRELGELGVDVLTVVCPACFMQYDVAQFEMQRQGFAYNVPVAALSELMAVAFGVPLSELGLEFHRVDVRPVLDRWASPRRAKLEELGKLVDLDAMARCVECQACSRDCDVVKTDPQFNPWDIFSQALSGNVEAALRRPELFKCVECYQCYELCYQRWGMIHGLRALKHMAIQRGVAPQGIGTAIASFQKHGVLTTSAASRRARLGLPQPPEPGADELRKLLSGVVVRGTRK